MARACVVLARAIHAPEFLETRGCAAVLLLLSLESRYIAVGMRVFFLSSASAAFCNGDYGGWGSVRGI